MAKAKTLIKFDSVRKKYGKNEVIKGVSFNIESNTLVSLVGLSGSGKTTLLRTINKLEEINDGVITINGEDINNYNLFDLRTSIGYVVQSHGLFPHMSVLQNLQLVRKIQLKKRIKKHKELTKNSKLESNYLKDLINYEKNDGEFSKAVFEKRIMFLLKALHLKDLVLKKKPNQLSGGQKQRIGILRAFLTNADIILMDEPFSALDPIVRRALQINIYKLKEEFKKTIVFVTHSPDEALALSDKIIVLDKGRIHFEGKPSQIKKSKDKFLRNFFLLDDDLEDVLEED